MALFQGQGGNIDVESEVKTLREQGLTDQQIVAELNTKGIKETQVISALGKLSAGAAASPTQTPASTMTPESNHFPGPSMPPSNAGGEQSFGARPTNGTRITGQQMGSPQDLYDRIEEITEEMIDEKWDDLIKEVRKIVEWKNSVENKMQKMESDLSTLKEDFKVLHQGVLGKVEEYDKRMQEVGVELKSVGKVFKDVVPVFTENVKELRSITKGMKEK